MEEFNVTVSFKLPHAICFCIEKAVHQLCAPWTFKKKTDGSVNIIGEVATDPVASWMIQAAQVASKFTLFTHHAKTFPN